MKSEIENYNEDQKLIKEKIRELVEVLVKRLEIELMNKKKARKKDKKVVKVIKKIKKAEVKVLRKDK